MLIVFILTGASSSVSAEEASFFDLSGSVRGGYWSSSRSLDNRENLDTASIWLKSAPKIDSYATFHFEGWMINDSLFHENDTKSALREGYLDLSAGPVDLRIGKQIIAWGRADQINPTDNLTPRDYTLLFPEDIEQRIGAVGLKASTFINVLSIQAYWIPYFKPNVIPIQQPLSQVTLREEEPGNAYGQWGIKFETTGGPVDGSLSYYDGFDLNPDIGIDAMSPSAVNLVLSHHRIQVIGMDGATTWGRFGLRGEVTYTFTEDSDGTDPFIKNPFFFMVVGGDRSYLEYLNINLQYIFRRVSHFQSSEQISDPLSRTVAMQEELFNNQLDQISQGVTGRISYKWLNETLQTEIAGIVMLTRHDYLIRPKISYAFTDKWKGLIAADILRGPEDSLYGYLWNNSTIYSEFSYHF